MTKALINLRLFLFSRNRILPIITDAFSSGFLIVVCDFKDNLQSQLYRTTGPPHVDLLLLLSVAQCCSVLFNNEKCYFLR